MFKVQPTEAKVISDDRLEKKEFLPEKMGRCSAADNKSNWDCLSYIKYHKHITNSCQEQSCIMKKILI